MAFVFILFLIHIFRVGIIKSTRTKFCFQVNFAERNRNLDELANKWQCVRTEERNRDKIVETNTESGELKFEKHRKQVAN